MGSQDEQVNTSTQIINDALQNVANYCSITCENNVSNVDITIIGGNASITVGGSCSAIGAECIVKNIVDSQITNLIENMIKQNESSMGIFSLLGPSSDESANITNSIKNQVSQLVSNTCTNGGEAEITNVNVFAQDANFNLVIGNNVDVNKAQCAIDTTTKLLLDNSVKNSVTQSESSCGSIVGILIVVAIILIIIIIFPILRALGKRGANIIAPGQSGQGGGQGGKSKIWIYLIALLVIVGIGVGVFFLIKDLKKNKKTT
jgi:hypothetical protein